MDAGVSVSGLSGLARLVGSGEDGWQGQRRCESVRQGLACRGEAARSERRSAGPGLCVGVGGDLAGLRASSST